MTSSLIARGSPDYFIFSSGKLIYKMMFSLFLAIVSIGGTASADSLSFMVIGDWGGQDTKPYTTDAEVYIAEYMGEVAKDVGSQFTIALGDNFYDEGVTDVNDKRFQETFEVKKLFLMPIYTWARTYL